MKKPPQIVLDLAALGRIHKVEAIDAYNMTSDLTRVVLTGRKRNAASLEEGLTLEVPWREVEPYLVQRIGRGEVMRLADRHQKAVTDWNKLMKEQAAEYAEFERLKAKFDADDAPAL